MLGDGCRSRKVKCVRQPGSERVSHRYACLSYPSPFCSLRTPASCMINVPLILLCLFSATIVERKRRLARESFFQANSASIPLVGLKQPVDMLLVVDHTMLPPSRLRGGRQPEVEPIALHMSSVAARTATEDLVVANQGGPARTISPSPLVQDVALRPYRTAAWPAKGAKARWTRMETGPTRSV